MSSIQEQNNYVMRVVATHAPAPLSSATYQALVQLLIAWGGSFLTGVYLSGSYAKQTTVRGSTDLDLLVSLDSSVYNAGWTLGSIYENLATFLPKNGYSARKQNVSIGTKIGQFQVDVVPGVKRPGNTNDHSLYLSKRQSWTQTNIQMHINQVLGSQRATEIRAAKIWRNSRGLTFPSFYLELSVLQALKNQPTNAPAANFLKVLDYLRDSFVQQRIQDPANTNNWISDDLTVAEKQSIQKHATASRAKQNWISIIS